MPVMQVQKVTKPAISISRLNVSPRPVATESIQDVIAAPVIETVPMYTLFHERARGNDAGSA
jgi:hypothetical protein